MKRRVHERLREAAASHQQRVIVPHCPSCTRPCCALTDVVLDLDWKRTQALYQIGVSRKAFDRSLRDGTGPSDIREQGGRYYAHEKPCPAYDLETKRCGVYGTDVKPPSCTDFPLYEDGDVVTADTRCEAVDIGRIEDDLRAILQAGERLERDVDPALPMFVSFAVVRR